MADKALELTGLAKEDYECHQVAQRKELPGVGFEFVEVNGNSPIQHGALYEVAVVRRVQIQVICCG